MSLSAQQLAAQKEYILGISGEAGSKNFDR